tara:strand:- start:2180 stop:2368 length:189 start_codon:yes stop_codon:yes gene_type:complete
MFVKFISKPIQEKLKARERALAWKTSNANAPVANGSIRPKDIRVEPLLLECVLIKIKWIILL